jgi:GMC oxidoreductase
MTTTLSSLCQGDFVLYLACRRFVYPDYSINNRLEIESQYTYDFVTVPQSHANGNQSPWARGKGLGQCSCSDCFRVSLICFVNYIGGTSLVNFQCWVTPPSQDLDAIEALGNPGWGWNDYVKYQKRVFTEVKLAPPRHSEVFDRMFLNTLASLGIEESLDFYNGKTVGSSLALCLSLCFPFRRRTLCDVCFRSQS